MISRLVRKHYRSGGAWADRTSFRGRAGASRARRTIVTEWAAVVQLFVSKLIQIAVTRSKRGGRVLSSRLEEAANAASGEPWLLWSCPWAGRPTWAARGCGSLSAERAAAPRSRTARTPPTCSAPGSPCCKPMQEAHCRKRHLVIARIVPTHCTRVPRTSWKYLSTCSHTINRSTLTPRQLNS